MIFNEVCSILRLSGFYADMQGSVSGQLSPSFGVGLKADYDMSACISQGSLMSNIAHDSDSVIVFLYVGLQYYVISDCTFVFQSNLKIWDLVSVMYPWESSNWFRAFQLRIWNCEFWVASWRHVKTERKLFLSEKVLNALGRFCRMFTRRCVGIPYCAVVKIKWLQSIIKFLVLELIVDTKSFKRTCGLAKFALRELIECLKLSVNMKPSHYNRWTFDKG
jgi:hypothetical protein